MKTQTPPAAGQAKALPQRWTADGDMITAPTGNIADCCDAETAAFIVTACNAHAGLVAALERAKRELSDCEDHLVRLRPDVQPDPYVTGCREALAEIDAALAAAKGGA